MQDIADQAGLSAGAIYRYFPGKAELLQSYFQHCVAEGPVAMINQAAAPGETAPERLKAAAHMVRDMWAEFGQEKIIGELETELASVRQPDELQPLLCEARTAVYDAIEAIVKEGQEKGEISAAFDSRELGIALHAFVYGIGMMSLNAPDNRDVMFNAFDIILDRIAPCQSWQEDATLNDE